MQILYADVYSNKVGVSANNWYDLQVGLVLEHPAIVYLVNDNVNENGNISVMIENEVLFLTSGGLGQNNTHFLPKGAVIRSITTLHITKYCYLI